MQICATILHLSYATITSCSRSLYCKSYLPGNDVEAMYQSHSTSFTVQLFLMCKVFYKTTTVLHVLQLKLVDIRLYPTTYYLYTSVFPVWHAVFRLLARVVHCDPWLPKHATPFIRWQIGWCLRCLPGNNCHILQHISMRLNVYLRLQDAYQCLTFICNTQFFEQGKKSLYSLSSIACYVWNRV